MCVCASWMIEKEKMPNFFTLPMTDRQKVLCKKFWLQNITKKLFLLLFFFVSFRSECVLILDAYSMQQRTTHAAQFVRWSFGHRQFLTRTNNQKQ